MRGVGHMTGAPFVWIAICDSVPRGASCMALQRATRAARCVTAASRRRAVRPLSLLVAQRLYRVETGSATRRVVAKHEADEHAYASGETNGAERDGWHEHRATGAA